MRERGSMRGFSTLVEVTLVEERKTRKKKRRVRQLKGIFMQTKRTVVQGDGKKKVPIFLVLLLSDATERERGCKKVLRLLKETNKREYGVN